MITSIIFKRNINCGGLLVLTVGSCAGPADCVGGNAESCKLIESQTERVACHKIEE